MYLHFRVSSIPESSGLTTPSHWVYINIYLLCTQVTCKSFFKINVSLITKCLFLSLSASIVF